MVPVHGHVDTEVGKKIGLNARSLRHEPAASTPTRAPV
jgi:hypothetical protein